MMDLKQAIDYLQPIADNTDIAQHGEALRVALDAMRDAMNTESAKAIYRAALETFGEEKQIIKLSQEIGEFLMAFTQYMEGRDRLSHVAEEMADVHIMLDQWAVHLGCAEEVERMKRYNLRRLEQRIEEVQGDGDKESM